MASTVFKQSILWLYICQLNVLSAMNVTKLARELRDTFFVVIFSVLLSSIFLKNSSLQHSWSVGAAVLSSITNSLQNCDSSYVPQTSQIHIPGCGVFITDGEAVIDYFLSRHGEITFERKDSWDSTIAETHRAQHVLQNLFQCGCYLCGSPCC